MRPQTIAVSCMLLAVALFSAGPPASAQPSPCKDTNSGFGKETAHCFFACGENEYVLISASVDDNGPITGEAACGGAGAACNPNARGYCSGSSRPTFTSSDNVGHCSATGDGGYYSRTHVYCYTQEASNAALYVPPNDALEPYVAAILEVIAFLFGATPDLDLSELLSPRETQVQSSGLGDLVLSELGPEALSGGLADSIQAGAHSSHEALMVFQDGAVHGFTCDGGVCTVVPAVCETTGDRWACTV